TREAETARAKALDDLVEREVAARRRAQRQPAVNGQKKCPTCGKVAAPDDRFCSKCGHALLESAAAPIPKTAHRAPDDDKRYAIGDKRSVSKWLLAAGVAAAVWAGVVGVYYFRARAAFESQRSIATIAAADYHSLAVLPADPNFVFFGHHGGLMWSSDGGANWQPASVTGDAMALAVHPADPLRLYLAGHDLFLRSDDGGRNWEDVAADLPGRDIHALIVAPDDPEMLYAFIVGQGLWRSANGGVNWTPVDPTLSENVMALAITPEAIYVGTDGAGVLRSGDGGAMWTSANGFVNGALDSPRVRALAYDPATGTLFAGTDRGLSFTTNVGSGWTRRPFNGDVAALALGPDGTTMLLVTSAGEVYRSRDRGVTWGGE
ncbi:MAG: zinc ribbon domain-containing protein, partial [Anaerolineae bacterium]